MKKLSLLATVVAVAISAWLTGCTTTSSNSSAIAASQKEMMLRQNGFVPKTVTTPKQQQQVAKLTPEVVSAVKYKGKLYYVYPTGKRDQIFVGRQKEYDAYKKSLQAQVTTSQPSQNVNGPVLTGETAGPNRIEVQEFDDIGPMEFGPEKTSSDF